MEEVRIGGGTKVVGILTFLVLGRNLLWLPIGDPLGCGSLLRGSLRGGGPLNCGLPSYCGLHSHGSLHGCGGLPCYCSVLRWSLLPRFLGRVLRHCFLGFLLVEDSLSVVAWWKLAGGQTCCYLISFVVLGSPLNGLKSKATAGVPS